MKPQPYLHHLWTRIPGCLLAALLWATSAAGQGRVVINEYMPWPDNGCPVTSEFVELYNFGPGPANIGCYVLTDGDYSITIPANTILLPGEYYVIAGMDVLPSGCGNLTKSVTAQLNWNTCNCTSGTIPTTGAGLFTDGGSGAEQVVLLNSTGAVVDAVIRNLPAEPSASITTSSNAGCTPFTFDLDDMSFTYEVLGMSTGRGNTFARLLDGDCGWLKESKQSAGESNNTAGDNSSLSAVLTVTNGTACPTDGSAFIEVFASDYTSVFPMDYTLAKDADNDNQYTINDLYTLGTDNTAPNIPLDNLSEGRYKVVIASAMGCDLKSFSFNILPCGSVLNPLLPAAETRAVEMGFRLAAAPGSKEVLLQWKADRTEYRLAVYNSIGQAIHTEKLRVTSAGVFQHRFNMPGAARGIFLLSLERTDGVPGKYIQRFFR